MATNDELDTCFEPSALGSAQNIQRNNIQRSTFSVKSNSISFQNSRTGNDLAGEKKGLPSFGNIQTLSPSPLVPIKAISSNHNVTPLIKNKNLTGIFTGSQNIMDIKNQTWGAIDVNNFAIKPAIKTQNQAQASEEASSRDTRLKM